MSNPNAPVYLARIEAMATSCQRELANIEARTSAGDLSDADKLMLENLRIQYQEGWNALTWALAEIAMGNGQRAGERPN